ncbi:MAG: ABC transporter ATP-binding protein [Candidatus Muiribacteriota bacterium]
MAVLEIDKVSKWYDKFKAVDEVSFKVSPGEIFGLLGPNGAGKSSTMRMIMNIITPDSGQIKLFGEKFHEKFKNKIGYLPEERGLYPKMKVINQLKFFGELKGMPAGEAKQAGREWLEKLQLSTWGDKLCNELSKGMAQKIQFIGTIIHNPELIIMDEPFSGLDPVNSRFLKNTLLELKNKNKAIILSTHLMENAEKLCENICLINKGHSILNGNLNKIKEQHGKNSIILKYSGDGEIIKKLPGIKFYNDFGKHMEINLNKNMDKKTFFREIAKLDIEITKYEATETSLDDVFIQVVEGEENEI